MSNRFLTVCLNPTIQKTLLFPVVRKNEVNRTANHYLDASGKGINVCRVLQQLGREAIHLTQLGGVFRPLFLDLCRKDGIDIRWAESGSAIRFCYTLLEESRRLVTELVEESEPVSPSAGEALSGLYRQLLPGADWLIISGTKAAGFSSGLVPGLVQAARELGKKIILDIRGEDLLRSLPFKPDLVKPNFHEFVSTFFPEMIGDGMAGGYEGKAAALCIEKARELSRSYETDIVITRGSQSVWAFRAGSFFESPVTPAIEALNTTGSGDAFTAGLASALSGGAGLEDAIAEGSRCGALNAVHIKPGSIR